MYHRLGRIVFGEVPSPPVMQRLQAVCRDAYRFESAFGFESWTVLVTTDHGQKALDEPSVISHFTQTPLEITSFDTDAIDGEIAWCPAVPVVRGGKTRQALYQVKR